MNSINPKDIIIRNFTVADIEPMAHYWSSGTDEFWLSMGVDKSKLKPKPEIIELCTKTLLEQGDMRLGCVIEFQGKTIGGHGLTDVVENSHGVFHAHIWLPEFRGLGIGIYSYLKASAFFMRKLDLKKIVFKTPKMNIGPNRVKQKIGIPCLGDTICNAPILINPLEANLYEMDEALLIALMKKNGIDASEG